MKIDLASIIDALETHYRTGLSHVPVWIGVCDTTYFLYCRNRAAVQTCTEIFNAYENVKVEYVGKIKALQTG